MVVGFLVPQPKCESRLLAGLRRQSVKRRNKGNTMNTKLKTECIQRRARKRRAKKRRLKKLRKRAALIKHKKSRNRRAKTRDTNYGPFVTMARFIIDFIGLRRLLGQKLSIKKGKNSTFKPPDIILTMIVVVILGCKRFYKIRQKFAKEDRLAKEIGLERFCSGDIIYRFLRECTQKKHRNELWQVNAKIIRENADPLIQSPQNNEVIADFDSTVLRQSNTNREGAVVGYNKKNKGQPCIQASAIFCWDAVISIKLHPGNEKPSIYLSDELATLKCRLGKVDACRLDAGYASEEHLRELDQCKKSHNNNENIDFYLGVGGNCLGINSAKARALSHRKKGWIRLNSNLSIMDFPSIQIYAGYQTTHRLLLVKKRIRKQRSKNKKVYYETKIIYYGIITNVSVERLSTLQLFRVFHQRQRIEIFFKLTKTSYFLEHLPSKKLLANEMYTLILALSFNLMALYKHSLFPLKYRSMGLENFQDSFFYLHCEFDSQGNLLIPRHFEHYRLFSLISSRLQNINVVVSYSLVYC